MANTPSNPKAYSQNTQIANKQRNMLFSKNNYQKTTNQYDANHPNAKSTGDRLGRGKNTSGQVGTSVDRSKRNTLMSKNLYNKSNKFI